MSPYVPMVSCIDGLGSTRQGRPPKSGLQFESLLHRRDILAVCTGSGMMQKINWDMAEQLAAAG